METVFSIKLIYWTIFCISSLTLHFAASRGSKNLFSFALLYFGYLFHCVSIRKFVEKRSYAWVFKYKIAFEISIFYSFIEDGFEKQYINILKVFRGYIWYIWKNIFVLKFGWRNIFCWCARIKPNIFHKINAASVCNMYNSCNSFKISFVSKYFNCGDNSYIHIPILLNLLMEGQFWNIVFSIILWCSGIF